MSFPPPPLHHYGDSTSGHSTEGEDYEVRRIMLYCFEGTVISLLCPFHTRKKKNSHNTHSLNNISLVRNLKG